MEKSLKGSKETRVVVSISGVGVKKKNCVTSSSALPQKSEIIVGPGQYRER